MIPFESFRVVVNDQPENIRAKIAKNTSAYCSWTKFRFAENPELPLLGEASVEKILITPNLFTSNAGRPLLRIKLQDEGNRTVINGRLGIHSAVGIFCGLFLLVSALQTAKILPFVGGLLVIVGGGYFYERGQLLRDLATCLEVDVREFRWKLIGRK